MTITTVDSVVQPEDTLAFWHPTNNVALDETYFQWGIVVPKSSADRQFRLRNLSYHYTATSVMVTLAELSTPARSVAAQHLLSLGGATFAATANVGDIGPRGISTVLTLRRVVAPDADEGFYDFQLIAHADDWT